MTIPTIHTFDHRQQILLSDPSEIREDDWLRDLGTLRQVQRVERSGPPVETIFYIHFVDQPGIADAHLAITEGTAITAWRSM